MGLAFLLCVLPLAGALPIANATTSTAAPDRGTSAPSPREWRISAGPGLLVPASPEVLLVSASVRHRFDRLFAGAALSAAAQLGGSQLGGSNATYEPAAAAQALYEIWATRSGIALLGGA